MEEADSLHIALRLLLLLISPMAAMLLLLPLGYYYIRFGDITLLFRSAVDSRVWIG